MKENFDRVISANQDLTKLVQDEKAATLSELEDGFSGTAQRLSDLETQAIQNAQELAKILDEQRDIMRELGIEHLYEDPNTSETNTAIQFVSPESPTSAPIKNFNSQKIRRSNVWADGKSEER